MKILIEGNQKCIDQLHEQYKDKVEYVENDFSHSIKIDTDDFTIDLETFREDAHIEESILFKIKSDKIDSMDYISDQIREYIQRCKGLESINAKGNNRRVTFACIMEDQDIVYFKIYYGNFSKEIPVFEL